MTDRLFNTANFWIAVLSVVSLVWYHGYGHTSEDHSVHVYWLIFALGYFTIQFAFKAYSSGKPFEFLRVNWLETTVYASMLLFAVSIGLDEVDMLGTEDGMSGGMQRLALHLFLLLISGVEMIAATSRSTIWRLPIPVLLVTSYLIIILAGSAILSLPMMVRSQTEPSYFQALFTSVSASCVTGLVTVNIAEYYTRSGQMVILILMQLGGLNIVAFATYFIARFSHVDRETLHGEAIKEVLSVDTFSGAKKLLQRVVGVAVLVELLGILAIYNWSDYLPTGIDRVFHASFHSVSAFNNAGFTIIDGGLASIQTQAFWPLHMSIATLIILGGLGFATLVQLGGRLTGRSVEGSSFNSRVCLRMAGLLTVLGMVIFLFLEWNNQLPLLNQIGHALFQSVTARTAGFNTLPIGAIGTPALVLLMILMFIGASPGSTGGGIKTTTVYALISSVKDGTNSIDRFTVRKALRVVGFGTLVVAIGTALIYLAEDQFSFEQVLFEQVSAFGTVGLSTGITPKLGRISLTVLMVSMFIGRVGPLAIAYSFLGTTNLETTDEETLIIG